MDDYGIGAAARVGLRIYEGASRGSGRSHRMVRGLRAGVIVVAPSFDHAKELERMARDLRPALQGVQFVSIGGAGKTAWRLSQLRSQYGNREMVLDHTIVTRLYEEALADVEKAFSLERGRFEQVDNEVEPVALRTDVFKRG